MYLLLYYLLINYVQKYFRRRRVLVSTGCNKKQLNMLSVNTINTIKYKVYCILWSCIPDVQWKIKSQGLSHGGHALDLHSQNTAIISSVVITSWCEITKSIPQF